MKIFVRSCFIALALGVFFVPQASASTTPTLDLEKKIAYQQGQFGALYAHCGSHQEQIVIGGSLANWRKETFTQYSGTPQERATLEKTFDLAASDVTEDSQSCHDWQKEASATWHGIVQLSEHGTPVALSKD